MHRDSNGQIHVRIRTFGRLMDEIIFDIINEHKQKQKRNNSQTSKHVKNMIFGKHICHH